MNIKDAFNGGFIRYADEIVSTRVNDVEYINLTPHALNFGPGEGEEGECFVVPASGYEVYASPSTQERYKTGKVSLISTFFNGDEYTYRILMALADSGYILIGSAIAAQAYPGLIVSVVPAKGYERRPPNEKRMNPLCFNIY